MDKNQSENTGNVLLKQDGGQGRWRQALPQRVCHSGVPREPSNREPEPFGRSLSGEVDQCRCSILISPNSAQGPLWPCLCSHQPKPSKVSAPLESCNAPLTWVASLPDQPDFCVVLTSFPSHQSQIGQFLFQRHLSELDG